MRRVASPGQRDPRLATNSRPLKPLSPSTSTITDGVRDASARGPEAIVAGTHRVRLQVPAGVSATRLRSPGAVYASP